MVPLAGQRMCLFVQAGLPRLTAASVGLPQPWSTCSAACSPRHPQASDHYTARLTQVLSRLTGRPTTARQADVEGGGGGDGMAAVEGSPP